LYWKIGRRINDEVLLNVRAEYGKQIVSLLAKHLTEEYGKGWGENHLRKCMQFATVFPDEQILYALRTKLSYLTALPSPDLLQQKLHKAIELARNRFLN
jgi:hypothetical protein